MRSEKRAICLVGDVSENFGDQIIFCYLLFVICYFLLFMKILLQRRGLWQSLVHFQSQAQSTFAQSQTGRQVLYFNRNYQQKYDSSLFQ